jgi:hypothetical protein
MEPARASPTVTVKVHPMVLDSEHWTERQKVQMKVCQMQHFSAGDKAEGTPPPKVQMEPKMAPRTGHQRQTTTAGRMGSTMEPARASPTVPVKVHPTVHQMERQKVQMKICQTQRTSA